jgi:hypothetical protein
MLPFEKLTMARKYVHNRTSTIKWCDLSMWVCLYAQNALVMPMKTEKKKRNQVANRTIAARPVNANKKDPNSGLVLEPAFFAAWAINDPSAFATTAPDSLYHC